MKAINAIETGDLGLNDPAFENAVSQWFAVLGQADSAFHALLSRQLIAQVPAQAAIATAVGAIAGDNPAEAMGAPISRITFDRERLKPSIVIAYAVATQEMLQAGGAGAQTVLGDAINMALRLTTDQAVYNKVTTSSTPSAAASGTDAVAALRDVRAAAKSVFSPGQSAAKGVWIMQPSTAIDLCCLAAEDGGPPVFGDLMPNGGSLLGWPVLCSPGWAEGVITLLDGSQACGFADGFGLLASTDIAYSAQLAVTQDAVGDNAQNLISAFQTMTAGFRAASRWMMALAREDAIYHITGAAYETAASA